MGDNLYTQKIINSSETEIHDLVIEKLERYAEYLQRQVDSKKIDSDCSNGTNSQNHTTAVVDSSFLTGKSQ